jgi:membrane protein implicated in regulation of membrane protease activity
MLIAARRSIMTNNQLYLAIGLPCLTIIVSLIVSLVQLSGVKDSIREIREDIRSLNAKFDILIGKVAELDTRLSIIEERFK